MDAAVVGNSDGALRVVHAGLDINSVNCWDMNCHRVLGYEQTLSAATELPRSATHSSYRGASVTKGRSAHLAVGHALLDVALQALQASGGLVALRDELGAHLRRHLAHQPRGGLVRRPLLRRDLLPQPLRIEFIEFIEFVEFVEFVEFIEFVEFKEFIEFIEFVQFVEFIEFIEFIEFVEFVEFKEFIAFIEFIEFIEFTILLILTCSG